MTAAPGSIPVGAAISQLLLETGALEDVTVLTKEVVSRDTSSGAFQCSFDENALVDCAVALAASVGIQEPLQVGSGSGNGTDDEPRLDARPESAADRCERLAPRAELIARKLLLHQELNQGRSLHAFVESDVCTAAALLAALSDKNSTFLAAVSLISTNAKSSAEAAIVWQADVAIDKTISQLFRVVGRLSATLAIGAAGKAELIISVHDAANSGGSGNARYALAVLLMLMGVILRKQNVSVWLKPFDIHVSRTAFCSRQWNPDDNPVVLSITGPWPWGDSARSKISPNERQRLAMRLVDDDSEMTLSNLELGTTYAIEEKRDQHVFILGETGAGKSSLGNILIGEHAFHVDSTKTGTLFPEPFLCAWGGDRNQVVWDVPGLNDTANRDSVFVAELGLVIDRVQLATAVLLVIRSPARIPHSLILALEQYIGLFGIQLALILRIIISDNQPLSADEMETYSVTIADQFAVELGLQVEPGFLLQIPTGPAPLSPASYALQVQNAELLRQSVSQTCQPILTSAGQKLIETLVEIRTTVDAGQQQRLRIKLLEQAGRQREVIQVLLSRVGVSKAFFDPTGNLLIQTSDLSFTSRARQIILQGQQDSRIQQRHALHISPDNDEVGKEIVHGLSLRKQKYSSYKKIRRTTTDEIFGVLNEGGFVLIPTGSAAHLSAVERNGVERTMSTPPGEAFLAARPTDQVSKRVLGAIADLLNDSRCPDRVVRLVQSCLAAELITPT
jgi:hypothetical protein